MRDTYFKKYKNNIFMLKFTYPNVIKHIQNSISTVLLKNLELFSVYFDLLSTWLDLISNLARFRVTFKLIETQSKKSS